MLGQCGNKFWGSTRLGGASGVQDSLLHEFTRTDSFHFIGVLPLFGIGSFSACTSLITIFLTLGSFYVV